MSLETRKRKIMEEMCAKDNVVQGIEDRLINLGKYQQYALEQTFGREFAPRKTFDNLVSFYRAMNQSFGLGLFDEVFSLRLACEEFKKEASQALRDVDDRYLIRPKIENYFRKNFYAAVVSSILQQDPPVLFDARYERNGRYQDFDTIIPTRGGVIFLDIRTPDCNISIDEEGNYISFYYQDARIEKYNLREKLKADQELLSDILEDNGAKDVPIIPVVVFSGRLAYSNRCGEIKTIRDRQIGEFLDEICSRNTLDDEALGRIHTILRECKKEIPKPSFPNEAPFIEAYADLRSKVEAKIVVNVNEEEVKN